MKEKDLPFLKDANITGGSSMKKLLLVSLCCAVAGGVFAESKPFQASLTPEIAIHSRDTHIEGVALSIWGENAQKAFALGFVNGSKGDSKGFSLGLLNYAENYTGVHLAPVNYATGEFLGWQAGFVNYAESMRGLQMAFVNYAGILEGVQLGLVNYAKTSDTGVQVGFFNLMPQTTEWFGNFPDEVAPAMVFVNWRL
jgi:hypothetical protein